MDFGHRADFRQQPGSHPVDDLLDAAGLERREPALDHSPPDAPERGHHDDGLWYHSIFRRSNA